MMAGKHKIGVLTFHKCINYGSYWQARCLVEGLRARGHDAELLDHGSRHVAIRELRCAFQPSLPERTPRGDFGAYAAKARRFFEAFANLPLSRPFHLHHPEQLDRYDVVVVGSDEVWNLRHPWYGGKAIFYGVGLQSRRLVSYAASFGSQDSSEGLHPWWAGHLDGFTAMSVRDRNSRRMVQQALGKTAELVLDPCLQFPEAIAHPRHRGEGRHAVVYGHGFPGWFRTRVRRWSRDNGIRLLSVGYRNDWADEQRIDAGPADFASLIAGSAAVITNFFHGCVFALLNAKPFATTPTPYRINKVRDLVASIGAERHMVDEQVTQPQIAQLLSEPLSPAISARIAKLRRQSNAFLDRALN